MRERLQATGGGLRVGDARALARTMSELVGDPVEAGRRGAAAAAAVPANLGPLVVTLALVRRLLTPTTAPVRTGAARP